MLSASLDVAATASNKDERKTDELPMSMRPSRSTIVARLLTRTEMSNILESPMVLKSQRLWRLSVERRKRQSKRNSGGNGQKEFPAAFAAGKRWDGGGYVASSPTV